ncbi:MAG TPA: NAD-dependent epimerase/dehydratase family protein [Sphingobacteriaceae bacterium]
MYNIPYHGDKDLSKLSFLVIGGAGFIGSNMVAYLLKYGAGKVRILDDFSTGSLKNLEGFSFYPSFELMGGDVTNLEDCNNAVKGIDIIIHEARLKNPAEDINDAKIKDLNMMIAANVAGVKRIVDCASSFIYGINQVLPAESQQIENALSSCVIAKYVNELYSDITSGIYGSEYIGLRYSNVFGPGGNSANTETSLIPDLISSLIEHKTPEINVKGIKTRNFTYIENVVQATIIAAISDRSIAMNQIYNVANGNGSSLNDLAVNLRDILSFVYPDIADIDISYDIESSEDELFPKNIAKSENLQCYYPYFSLKEALMETVRFYLEQPKRSQIFN